MAKTGQARKTKQPLNIDRLPPAVHDAIRFMRNVEGLTWQEIEARSAEPIGKGKLGFVPWDQLPTPVLELFPDMRLPHTTLHRWWDLRVEQVQANVMRMATQARSIAKVFAKAAGPGDRVAVQGAARDILLGILAEDGTPAGRAKIAGGLIALAEVQQKTRANEIRERKVAVEEQALQIKLDEIKRKADELLKELAKKGQGEGAMSAEQVMGRVREFYNLAT